MEERMNTEIFDLFGYDIYVSEDHRFGTDALLLAEFAAPSPKDIVCDLCSGCGIVPMLFHAWGRPPAKAYSVEIQEEAVHLSFLYPRAVTLDCMLTANVLPHTLFLRIYARKSLNPRKKH